jgi:CubicO group peptidase (beta-lactamase class C family)
MGEQETAATGRHLRTGWQAADGELSLANWQQGWWNRWSFRHIRQVIPTALISRGDGESWTLPADPVSLRGIRFESTAGEATLAAFLETSFTDGFLVLRDGHIAAERYYHGMRRDTRHLLMSVSKSLTGTLAGALIGAGLLEHEELVTTYVPELAEASLDGATVRHLLDMTAGTAFSEDYADPLSDISRLRAVVGWLPPPEPGVTDLLSFVATLPSDRPHGEVFGYRSVLTDALGLVLERASGLPFAEAMSRFVWAPLGPEHDAEITVDPHGNAVADGGMSSTLRDLARVGQLYLQEGNRDGLQVLPTWWVADTGYADAACRRAFVASADAYRLAICDPDSVDCAAEGHYRNQWWVPDPERGVLLASGIHGQALYIDAAANVVIAKLSSQPAALDPALAADTVRACRAVTKVLGDGQDEVAGR